MAFPTTLPSYIITAGSETANGAGGGTGLSGLLNAFEVDITAIGTKIGTGAAVPANNQVLVGSGAGTSIWSATLAGLTLTSPTINTPTITSPIITSPIITSPPTNIGVIIGELKIWPSRRLPTDYLWADGSAVSRATYASLFSELNFSVGTCTITNATPAVVTLATHGLQTGDQVYLTTTGGLPTGLSINTLYYAIRIGTNTFNLATTRANAYAGTKIATSSAGSGVHTLSDSAWGNGNGSTTFTLPDMRGRVAAGNDAMNGTAASRLTNPSTTTNGVYGNLGSNGGEQGHTQLVTEMASHNHELPNGGTGNTVSNPGALFNTQYTNGTAGVTASSTGTGSTGGATAANVVQPTLVTNYIIKAL